MAAISSFPGAEGPNARSAAEGVTQTINVISVADGKSRKLADGYAPAVSPRGDRVAFLAKKQVMLVALDGTSKAEPLIAATGDRNTLRWSPDGTKLAFVASRREHSLIGVLDVATKSLRYLDPSIDRDIAPVWSPDGRQLAYLRVASTRDALPFAPHREGEPWSIRVADVATGKSRQVWRADRGSGSVYRGIDAEEQLLWAANDRLVFPWEKDGWTHLYSISLEGGAAPALLTPGVGDVEHAQLTPDRREVVYVSNQEDIDRRHLWRVAAAGGSGPVALTKGSGIEWSPRFADKTLVLLHSDATHPARAAVLANGVARDLVKLDYPSEQLVEPQQVMFTAADGMRIHAQLFLPKGERRHPALVFFHGGSRRQMLLGFHYMGYYHNAYAMNQYLASRGYVVLAVNYRSGIGYGRDFREAEHYGITGASEFQDVVGAGLYLRSRSDVDSDRIGLWGGSYGGFLTALGLARASNLFAAGVDMHGVHDWNATVKLWSPTYDPDKQGEVARAAWLSSPLAYVDTWKSPVLVVHGDDDRNVNFTETVHLVEELRKRDVEVEQLIFPDDIHDFLLWEHWVAAYQATSDFFDRQLRANRASSQ